MKKIIEEIVELSDTEKIWSSDEMQSALEKINEKAKQLLDKFTYRD